MLRIVGRSSSHFTRCVRVFAHELQLPYAFDPVLDLMARSDAAYGGNPALKLPVLMTEQGAWFGVLNCCRELARRASSPAHIVWPEDLTSRVASNAQELVLQGMSTVVGLVMRSMAEAEPRAAGAYDDKGRLSLVNSVSWLDAHLLEALHELPAARTFSFLEVSAFCFVTHLRFREVLDTSAHAQLEQFCRQFGQRASAQVTPYGFDRA